MNNYIFPESPKRAHDRPVIFHRFRIIVPAFDEEQANRIANRIAEFASCDIERIWAVTDQECTEVLGEAVIERRSVPLTQTTPSEKPA
jgi:hypothetical protein